MHKRRVMKLETIQQKACGKFIKVKRATWDIHEYFLPKFIDNKGSYHGLLDTGQAFSAGGSESWQIYKEPVEMEDRWQWSHESGRDTTSGFHTEEVAKSKFPVYKVKLEWTKMKFPKEDD